MKKRIFNKLGIFILLMFFIVPIAFSGNHEAKAQVLMPDMKVSVEKDEYGALVDEDIEIKYRVEPSPVDAKNVSKPCKKDIVLVIDTSGSMNSNLNYESRMEALKNAATSFIKKFQDSTDVRIGIVTYNDCATRPLELTSSIEQYKLLGAIKTTSAEGATNIGDGIRLGIKMLCNANNDAKKYLILMSDGMPTSLSYKGYAGGYRYIKHDNGNHNGNGNGNGKHNGSNKNKTIYDYDNYDEHFYYLPDSLKEGDLSWDYYDIDDNSYIRYGTYGNNDPNELCLNYSKLMATRAKEKNISNYIIGFSGGSNSNKLMQIANSSGGSYYDAEDENTINEVYSSIGDQIRADYAIENVKLQFSLPQNIELADNNYGIVKLENEYVKSIENIKYRFDKNSSKYVADPFNIVLKIKGKKSGSYTLDAGAVRLIYNNIFGQALCKNMPTVKLNINKLNIDFDVSRKLLPEQNKGEFTLGKEFEIEYKIVPKAIPLDKSKKPKEIMLVVDTSGSMNYTVNKEAANVQSRLDATKVALNNFIDKFKDDKDVKIGLVTYSDVAKVNTVNGNNFYDYTNLKKMKENISALKASGGTNLGDGLRKALWALSANKEAQKYIVLMSDGEPTFYSYNDDEYYTEIDNNDVYTNDENDFEYGLEYSNIMAAIIKDNIDLDIDTFAIGFSTDAASNKLTEISKNAGGTYKDATVNNTDVIKDVYMSIADEIKTDFTLDNIVLSESLPKGLTLGGGQNNSISKSFKVNYSYNNVTKQYEAEPITFKVKVKADKIGEYNLQNDGKLEYKDLEGVKFSKDFNSLRISITDEYVIKQGLFQPGSNSLGTLPGESNIKQVESADIIKDAIVRLGTYVRTGGQTTQITIEINKDKNNDIEKLNNISMNVYKISSDGSMKLIETRANITPSNKEGNYVSLDVTLPEEKEEKYGYYIINYNFSGSIKYDNVSMISSCKLQNTNRKLDLNIRFNNLPDLF